MYTLQWAGAPRPIPISSAASSTRSKCRPAGFNRGHFSDPEVDRLSTKPRSRPTPDERRRALTEKCSNWSPKLAPYISLWHRDELAAGAAEITGIRLAPQLDFSFLRNVSR